jgi:hypothetical protein
MSQPEQLSWKSKFKWNGKDGLNRELVWNGNYQNQRINMAIHVSLGFAKLKDKELIPFTAGVVTGLTGNTACPTPPVTAIVLDGHRKIFEDALAQSNKGSVDDTAAKDDARDVLVDDLRQDAAYVEQKAGGVASVITSTGFDVTTHEHNPVAIMPKAIIKQIINSASGQLLVRGQAIDNVHSLEAQIQIGTGPWQPAGTFTQARNILLLNLTPGTTYTVRIRAVGGNNTYGEWSDPVSHICT